MPLYHYTDLHAVVSILTNRKLWLTDIRYLNDKAEFEHGVAKLKEKFPHSPNGLFHNELKGKPAREILSSCLDGAAGLNLSLNPAYVTSLSKSGDALSQWRGYGGYAIEFDEKILADERDVLFQCLYEEKEKDGVAILSITDAITSISHCIDDNNCMAEKGHDAIFKLLRTAARFKDKGFEEEQEYRLIMNRVDPENVKYRVRGNILIPYVEFEFSLDAVKAIHIGPLNQKNLADEGMQGFCSQIERNWQFESDNIEYWLHVKCSGIPYRQL